jgi:hypothetical protein
VAGHPAERHGAKQQQKNKFEQEHDDCFVVGN